ncbi:DsbA family protein [Salinibacterium sp. PAMC 21357]|uniref:DsbA family protein n=1 Tax=Salinibacterium sp. PAMC 21357 TaxID=1112215 RepID=UPI0002888317|nr:thioredoxin domain-containing protein [Salinibacterium sp. PAMC 21357]
MSKQTSSTGRKNRGARSWLVPIGIIVIAGVLLATVILQFRPDQTPADTVADAGDSNTAPSEQPDLTQLEYRDPADVQAAGPVDAPIGLIVYADYQCAFCAKWTQNSLPTMMEYADAGDLRIEWRDINMYGEPSERASRAAHAAGLQSQFWQFHDALYRGGVHLPEAELTTDALVALATELGLDAEQFAADMDSPAVVETINMRAAEARQIGVTGTPTFILNGVPIVGAQPTEVFVDAIESALTAAENGQ